MKLIKSVLVALAFTPVVYGQSECDVVPVPPSLLELAELTAEQLDTVTGELNTYFEQVETYKACIDDAITQLAPEDAPLDYYDSPEYQARFEQLNGLVEAAQHNADLAIDRHNYLLSQSVPAEPSPIESE